MTADNVLQADPDGEDLVIDALCRLLLPVRGDRSQSKHIRGSLARSLRRHPRSPNQG